MTSFNSQPKNIIRWNQHVDVILRELPKLGFIDCSLEQHVIFELKDDSSKTHLLLITNGDEWRLRDGRIDIDWTYYQGNIENIAHLIRLICKFAQNCQKDFSQIKELI